MTDRTEISWTDSTFNPWMGCTKVGPGCDHCYAERDMDHRYGKVKWGAGQPRVRTKPANWRKPVQWNKQRWAECGHCGWRGDADGAGGRCPICPPAGGFSLTPARRRVFCASLADVFDNEVDPQWRRDLFALILDTPNLDWLLLTKRIGNVERMVQEVHDALCQVAALSEYLPPPLWPQNIWLGATVVNQEGADRDIPKLLALPAHIRFLSCEPLLGPIELNAVWLYRWIMYNNTTAEYTGPRLHWVIVGGESGQHARPLHPDWVRSLRDQCTSAQVPFHFKQNGEFASVSEVEGVGAHHYFPDGTTVRRVGKKAAGRTLDGRVWNEFPTTDGAKID